MFLKKAKAKTQEPAPVNQKIASSGSSNSFTDEDLVNMSISDTLTRNMEILSTVIGENTDYVRRNVTLGRKDGISAEIIYFDNLVDSELVDKDLIRPLVLDAYSSGLLSGENIIEQLDAGNLIPSGKLNPVNNFKDFLYGVLKGESGLLIDGIGKAYLINTIGYSSRNVEQPDVEPVVRGPKEAFIEVIRTNIGMIRRRIHSPNLVFEKIDLGCITETKVCISYIKGICLEELSNEVRSRIKKINIDGVLESSYIEEQIQDSPYSLFPQMRTTERPDSVAASLLEGRVAIIVDNTPVVIIVPGEFFSLLQSAEDYYNRYVFSSLMRLLRLFAFTLALILPALYISVVNYHQEMIPTSLLASIIASRSNVPLPAFLEALLMEITFEILREAGVRLPKQVGQAVSIVGALVIGQAAVQASIVSPLMVIVVALTGISSFCIPQYSLALPVRVLRFVLMILAAVLGLFGVMIGILFLMMHLFSMESFGKPYMAPIGPFRASGLKDTVLRYPWWSLSRFRIKRRK